MTFSFHRHDFCDIHFVPVAGSHKGGRLGQGLDLTFVSGGQTATGSGAGGLE